jgi:two-component system, OmpR family, sensor kinase
VNLPIRARLTAWYVAFLAAIIVGVAAFVVVELRSGLLAQEDHELRNNWNRIAADYADEGLEDFYDASRMILAPGSGAQVLDSGGRLLGSHGAGVDDRTIIPVDVRSEVLAGQTRVLTVESPGDRHDLRAIARPVRRLGQRHVLVVAESLEAIDTAVQRVLLLLTLAIPAALAATAFGGWLLARKALLPVERMTSKAEHIGIDRLDERIAVPRGADEIGHLAVTLNAMLDRLERGVAEKQRLIGDASHELRTPLAVMRTELDVSLRGELSSTERAVLASVREEVDRMSRTVDNLLTLAQVDEGRLELLTRRVRLAGAIDAAVRPLAPLAEARGVRLEVDTSGHPADVEADPERLHLVLTNLIENAIKFSPSGSEVRVSAWRRRWEVGVTVTDSGPGIAADAREQIFDRFFRADQSRARTVGGSGLGLSISREIAHAHGGRLWVDSEEGRGSAFSLALPRFADGAREQPVGAEGNGLKSEPGEVTLRDS